MPCGRVTTRGTSSTETRSGHGNSHIGVDSGLCGVHVPGARRTQAQIWSILATTETALCEQFRRFEVDLAKMDSDAARVSKLPLSIFYTARLLPQESFDLRKMLAIHAHGIEQASANSRQPS